MATAPVPQPPAATTTEKEQLHVERSLHEFFERTVEPLHRAPHVAMLARSIRRVPARMQGLDCSRPWLCYWILHAADMLGALDDVYAQAPATDIAALLLMCLQPDCDPSTVACDAAGAETLPRLRVGFGGGPGQMPHLAASYAAVSALAILQQASALREIDRAAVQRWLVSLRLPDGGFRMHRGGEGDLRATYCACVVATLLNLDMHVIFTDAAKDYIARCQTYEGGFGSCVDGGGEAHGGYTQCGIAAATMLDCCDRLDLPNLRRFCAMRQLPWEGGFCGRANKLVDSCYSFWLGSSCVLAEVASRRWGELPAATSSSDTRRLSMQDITMLDFGHALDLRCTDIDIAALSDALDNASNRAASQSGNGDWFFDQRELQYYVLQCCQDPSHGGCKDKPSVDVDFYHSCYALSGASLASNNLYVANAETQLMSSAAAKEYLPDHCPPDLGAEPPTHCSSSRFARSQVWPYGADMTSTEPKKKAQRGARAAAGDPTAAAGAASTAAQPAAVLLRPVSPVFNVCRDKVQWMFAALRPTGAALSFMR